MNGIALYNPYYVNNITFGKSLTAGTKKNRQIAKKVLISSSLLGGAILADLFLAKGKLLSKVTKGKVNFIKVMSADIDNVIAKDNYATRNRLEAFLTVPGLHALWNHRIAHKLHEWEIPVLPRIMANISRFFTGIEIHPGAKIGKNLFIDHTGAIIGETAQVGDDVTIIGRAVLGSVGKGEYLRHTIVDDNVTIGMNSLLLGRIKLGKNSKIGAGAVVTHDVPQNVTVIGNPAKIITINGSRIKEAMLLNQNSIKEVEEVIKNGI